MPADIDALLSLAREVGATWEFSPAIEFPNALALQEFAQHIRAEQQALIERLTLEAQMHAQEARTQRATVREIYQIATGGTGEPADWNGAEPVRQAFERIRQDERERAARICDTLRTTSLISPMTFYGATSQCAAAIRSSGTSQSNPLLGGGNG